MKKRLRGSSILNSFLSKESSTQIAIYFYLGSNKSINRDVVAIAKKYYDFIEVN